MSIIETTDYYRIVDETYYCCDEFMFRYYCLDCEEFMGCYYCQFDYTEPCKCGLWKQRLGVDKVGS